VSPSGQKREKHITKLQIVESVYKKKPEDEDQLGRAETGARFDWILNEIVVHREKLYIVVQPNSNLKTNCRAAAMSGPEKPRN
jgi:hypothetical protein